MRLFYDIALPHMNYYLYIGRQLKHDVMIMSKKKTTDIGDDELWKGKGNQIFSQVPRKPRLVDGDESAQLRNNKI